MSYPAVSYPAQAISPKFENILFATDFSPCSAAALPYACAIAERYNSTIHVLHVLGLERLTGELGMEYADLLEAEMEAAQRKLQELTDAEAFSGIRHTGTITRGNVLEIVSRLAREHNVDLIVVGTHGRRGLQQVVLGSVAEQIFHRAPCPVLTVGPQVRNEAMAKGKLATIFYATDFSPASLHALDYAVSLARAHEAAQLILFHAISETGVVAEYVDKAFARAKQELTNLLLTDRDIGHQTRVACGPAAATILDAARDTGADLIVMGAHAGSSVSGHVPWAVTHVVVCHAASPVLTVRA